jgi:phosphoglycolate phosphatase
MATYSAVLFDLDGTILDSAPGVFRCFEHTFRMMRREAPSRESMRKFLGPPLSDTFATHFGWAGEELERAITIYRTEYFATGAITAELYPGVIDVVRAVRAAGIPVGLATSKSESGVSKVLDHFEIGDEFDIIGSASDDETRSAKADVVRFALDQLEEAGADTSRVVLVGDRIHDIGGAAANGIPTILVGWGYGTDEERALASAAAATTDELRALLGV